MMSKEELEVLRLRARRGWIALGVGGAALLASCFCLGYHTGKQRTYEQAREAYDMLLTDQKQLYAHISTTKNETLVERRMLLDAAKSIKQRDEIVLYNQENVCPDLQRATASRKTSVSSSKE